MSMGVMYERLGPYAFEKKRELYQKVTCKYWYDFVEEERFWEDQWNFTIQALPEWKHRFFGVTKDGVPIWGKKRRQYKHIGGDITASVAPRYQSEVYQSDKECQTEEVTSFVKWKKGNKKLAFIYLGIFWTLEEGETLNDAAKRFINAHQEVKKIFRKYRKKIENACIPEHQTYIYELYRDGAMVFYDGKVLLKEKYTFFDTVSGLWAIMAAEGFFAKENVKELEVGTDFWAWYKS